MNFYRHIRPLTLLLFTLVCSIQVVQSQIFDKTPIDFDQIHQAQVLRNPGYNHHSSKLKLSTGYKGFSTLSSNLHTFYADFSVKLPKEKLTLGVQLYQDKEGKLISHDRLYVKSNYTVPLGDSSRISFGLAFGGINFQIKNNIASNGFSDRTIDLKAGTHFVHHSLDLQASFLQLLERDLTFIENQITLVRYYQFLGGYQFKLSHIHKLTPSVYWRSDLSTIGDIRIRLEDLIFNKVYLAGTLQLGNGYILEAGIKNLNQDLLILDLGLSFRRWINNDNQTNANIFEITLGIGIPNKKGVTNRLKMN